MMFKSCFYNTNTGSYMDESSCAASSFCLRLIMDTVVAVSIFAVLALISSVIVLAELSVIILAILSVVIVVVAVLLAAIIIESFLVKRPNPVEAN